MSEQDGEFTLVGRIDVDSTSVDGLQNFLQYKEQSASFKGKPVFPSKPINPKAKPIQLNPPQ